MSFEHRQVDPDSLTLFPFSSPFSCFDFIDNKFAEFDYPAIRRCFSLARSAHAKTLVFETIPPAGIIADENDEITELCSGFNPGSVLRLSFWRRGFQKQSELKKLSNADLIGYLLLKEDVLPYNQQERHWHIFEAVFRKYAHRHNCVPNPAIHQLRIGGIPFQIPGVLYCQQNGLNKCCAHVALRSLITRLFPVDPVSYRTINQAAQDASQKALAPGSGLNPQQMTAVLDRFGIPHGDIDYEQAEEDSGDEDIRRHIPYQPYLYAGIESGCGGLLGFKFQEPPSPDHPDGQVRAHIIPFYGHTFNKDTWSPDAEVHYFNIGGNMGYIPSSSWTSSFLGHDDNFGPNFCVPRLYVQPEQAEYVVELRRTNAQYGGITAEAQSILFLYSLIPYLDKSHPWQRRLIFYANENIRRVILRTVCVKRSEYISHLSHCRDWEGNDDDQTTVKQLDRLLPDDLWVVEVSVPHLFPANERKLGEILLDAGEQLDTSQDINQKPDFRLFLLARLPGMYFFLSTVNQYGPTFAAFSNELTSHMPVLRKE